MGVASTEEEMSDISSLSSAADAAAACKRRSRVEDGFFWKVHVRQAWYWRHGAKAEVKEVGGAAEAASATANTADLLSEYIDLAFAAMLWYCFEYLMRRLE